MKAHLLYRERDFSWHSTLQAATLREVQRSGRRAPAENFDRRAGLPWNHEALCNDLELDTLIAAMAGDDDWVFEVARRVLLTGLENDIETIRYRQDVLRDCLNHPAIVRQLYAIAVEGMEKGKNSYLGTLSKYPHYVLRDAIELIERLLDVLRSLRAVAGSNAPAFSAEGWTTFFAMVREELSEEYLTNVQRHLRELRFRRGVLLGARLGKGNKASGYVLHLPPPLGPWPVRLLAALRRLFEPGPPVHGFSLHPRDESGGRMLSELRDRGTSQAASALARSADHVRDFFIMLRLELAFYVGCINLHDRLAGKGEPVCMPTPDPGGGSRLSSRRLYDVCLALHVRRRVVGNDVSADGKQLVIITGANQGGKSTFLRSVGLAQLMMQCGMFVPAEAFRSGICDGLFTHYKREEDMQMQSGKLDEELGRMSEIIDHLTPHAMILFNESFAATNEREGSEIARQILSALLEKRFRMIFVTHLYEFAQGIHDRGLPNALFLRAEREPDGTRTFKLAEGEPLRTSFGEDLFDTIFANKLTEDGFAATRERAVAR